ncbi:MAG: hypothetical protein V1921_00900 [Candidatus Altiarchaeota archaeon]
MEIEIKNERDNKLLSRREVTFKVKYEGATPSMKQVRGDLIKKLKADEKLLVVDNIRSEFGARVASGYAKVYGNINAMKIEPEHIMRKNFEQKKEEKAAEPDEAKASKEGAEGKPKEKEEEKKAEPKAAEAGKKPKEKKEAKIEEKGGDK